MAIGPDGTGVVDGHKIGPGVDLREVELQGADLEGADLSDADLRRAVFRNVNLKNVNFSGADLREFQVDKSSLSNVDFTSADLCGAAFSSVCFIDNVNFNDANLRGVCIYMVGASMLGVSLKNAVLDDASILVWPIGRLGGVADSQEEFISGEQINEAKSIKRLSISGLGADKHTLKGIDFSHKNAAGLRLAHLAVQGADFYGADLRGAEFSNCDIIGSDFSWCRLDGSVFKGDTTLRKLPAVLVGCAFDNAFLKFSVFFGMLIGLEEYGRDRRIRANSNSFQNAKLEGSIFNSCSILVEQFDAAEADYIDLELCRLFDRDLGEVPEIDFVRKRDNININGLKISPGAHLERANLSGQDLRGVDLTNAHLEGANLSHADLSFSSLKDADLEGAHLDHAFLRAVDINGANLREADLRKSRITSKEYEIQKIKEGAKIPPSYTVDDMVRKAHAHRVRGADFYNADLSGAHIGNIFFSGGEELGSSPTNLKKANFYNTDLDLVVFDKLELPEANFKNSRISQSRYIDSDLRGAEFDNSYIHASRLDKVNLEGASFKDAKIEGARLSSDHYDDADFSGADISASIFDRGERAFRKYGDLRKAKFEGSTIDEDTDMGRPHTWSPSLKKYFAPVMLDTREALDRDITNHPRYMGVRNGLWIHQTSHPKTKYRGELCVSPYEKGEEIWSGQHPYGVVFEGAAPYFNSDVWSGPNRFGMIEPADDGPTTKYKEGFLNTGKARIVRLNVLEGYEHPGIIKKFKAAGIPIYLIKDEEEKERIGRPSPEYLRQRALKMTDYDKKSGRLANPGYGHHRGYGRRR